MLTVYCRMCLNPSQFNEIVSLFDTYKGFCIRDAVLELFQIKILPTEMLSNICKKCVAMVCTVRDIREEFIAQNLKYQQMISNSSEEESNATQPQHAVKQSPLAAEPSPEVESTTEQQLDQGETCESVESLELMEVKDTIASDNGDSNSIICYVEQLDTDGQDMSQSEIQVKLVPGNSGKSPVRFEIATTRDDYDSEEVDVLEAKNNGNNATSVQEYCTYSEDSSEPTVVHSEKGTISYTSIVICPHCSDVFDEDKQLLQHGQEKHPELFQIIQCNECTEEFGTTEALNKHV
uniref:ZAD domain-containing protein n=1 Tax=Anopheles minimus TaxID=112268 RepID=A0A182VQE9_9DIPT